MYEKLFEDVVKFHGHICPGISFGYRATLLALRLMGFQGKNIGQTHTVISENDVCGVDAIQFVSGCTIGNDSLLINNVGKQAYSFVNKKNGEGYRIMLKVPLWKTAEPLHLHELVKTGVATDKEKEEFIAARTARGKELMEIPDDELLVAKKVKVKLPKKARLTPEVTCSVCHEKVMSAYIETLNGEPICLSCKEEI